MSAIPVLLADAVTSVINAESVANAYLPHMFTAERSYPTWDDDFSGLKGLAVNVVFVASESGDGATIALDSDQSIGTMPAIDVAVRKRFEPSDRDSSGDLKSSVVDELVELIEQIYETLASDRMQAITLEAGIHANWVDASVRTFCDYGRLRQGLFLGVVRIRFDVSKAI